MSELFAFFAQNVQANSVEEFIVSERFKDKDGKPAAWKLRTMTEAENEAVRKSATRQEKGKNGVRIPHTDPEAYVSKLIVGSIVYPDLKDAELQKSYGVIGAEELLKKMLLSGEYAALAEKVQEINGFNQDVNELADEVKN